ncbi:hypothetical protein COS50_04585 [Candidatus Roizmanbacteria bacterium CG03_land_8_20_14_0_80_35_26]|uniref:Uncharacterized protein n=1 Tax=Candidatus Roizmanbacteria bacterium CG03_land_8_20_14_0_80_35_26 TaxID=1974845 RepID=A0A2M7BVP2_9BACT|nr:MAG: hypothetical protein COS50_04585 [Candidatus Roizmanbacteria bacterium CG03_land_8_20_14_0_80_35_26]
MPMISRNKVDDEVLEKLFSLFFEVVGKRENKEEFQRLINDVFSSTERIMVAKRIAIIYLLTKNIDYRIICEVLKVSASTVFKFRLLTEESKGIVPILKKILRGEKISQFFEEILLTFNRPGKYGVNWSQAWKDKMAFERKKETGI